VRRALTRAAAGAGVSVAASRLTSGNHPVYVRLESVLRRWLDFPAAILTGSGYSAPAMAAQALAKRVTHFLLPTPVHGCLEDAAQSGGPQIVRFRDRDPESLADALHKTGRHASIALLTEGLSGHDGTVPPLAKYLELLPARSWMVVDDAHGIGTLGGHGRGVLEHLRVRDRRVLLTITFSKALGTHGGALLGPDWLSRAVKTQCRAYAGGTPLPPPLVAATLEAIRILRRDGPPMRRRLENHLRRIRAVLDIPGFGQSGAVGPAVALPVHNRRRRHLLHRALLRAGILPPWIEYPGGPYRGFFRFALSPAHSTSQIQTLATVLRTQLPTQSWSTLSSPWRRG
jgi:8-amino-7-oxononanoate synthase